MPEQFDATGQIIPMTPTGGDAGARNGALVFQLQALACRSGAWQVFDSSIGFRLPDASGLNPDGSLVRW